MNSHKKTFAFTSLFFAALLLVAPLHVIYADDSSSATTTDVSITTPDTLSANAASTTGVEIVATATSTDETTGSNPTTTPKSESSTTTSTSTTTNTSDSSPVVTAATSTNDSTASSTPSTPQTGTATITVRDGSVIAWHGTVSFPIGTSTTAVTPTNSSSTVAVSNQSLLGVLLNAESTETGFTISNLAYYPSFGEFLINCVSVPAANPTPDCYDWQYEVNGNYPFSGIDQYQLHDGDQAYLYFGNPRQVVVSTSTVPTGTSFVATAESYDPATGTYASTTGYTIGVTQPDPNNPWSPTEIATSTTDENGNATFTLTTAGSYGVGLQEDYYSNLTPVTVTTPATSTASSTDNSGDSTTNSGGSSGGGGGSSNPVTANTAAAFSFLTSHQNADGSFNGSEVTDWSALALALPDAPSGARANLAHYLTTTDPIFSITRDYERHALALMALGINPYSGSPQDTITPIVKAFNGSYIVDSSDDPTNIIADIFALIVLPHAGYSNSDAIMQKTESFVLAAQASNGSWFGGNPDITGAAIQALSPLSGTSGAIARAESFLRQNQQSNGGFSNSDSTSWVLNGIAAHGESPSAWTVGTTTPLTYLASNQQSDGGINVASPTNSDSRTWSTAYALTAFEGRSWSSLLGNFARPANTGSIGGTGTLASSTATSTLAAIATTTPVTTATSSVPLLKTLIAVEQPHATTTVAVHKKKRIVSKAVAEQHSLFSLSTSSIAAAITNHSIEAGAASAPAATSVWLGIAGAFSHLGSFLSHLI